MRGSTIRTLAFASAFPALRSALLRSPEMLFLYHYAYKWGFQRSDVYVIHDVLHVLTLIYKAYYASHWMKFLVLSLLP